MFQSWIDLVRGNVVLTGMLGVWGLSVMTYLCRSLPARIWVFMKRHFTTSMSVTSCNTVFHNLDEWMEAHSWVNRMRVIRFTNGKWGSGGKTIKAPGYGTHFLWYEGTPFLLSLNKEETRSEYEKLQLTITVMGRNHGFFDRILTELRSLNETPDQLEAHIWRNDWQFLTRLPKRPMYSIILDEALKQQLIQTIQRFLDMESWYVENGIPYRLNLLLYGDPGTGKTSLIQALASHFGRGLCILEAADILSIGSALASARDRSFVVLEDIHTCRSVITRKRQELQENRSSERSERSPSAGDPSEVRKSTAPPAGPAVVEKASEEPNKDRLEELFSAFNSGGTLSVILNAIDGLLSTHGRILFMTANYIETMDPAMLRPGRVDLAVEIPSVTMEAFTGYISRFFPGQEQVLHHRKMRCAVTGAELQKEILIQTPPETIVEKYTVEETPHP